MNMAFIQVNKIDIVAECDADWRVEKLLHKGVDMTLMFNSHTLIDAQNEVIKRQDEKARYEAEQADWAEWDRRMMSDPAMFKASGAREAR